MKWKIGGLYRKVARSTNAFKVYFPIQMRGFAIIEISFFLNVIGNLREGNVPTSPSLPMRTEWPSIAIWQACVGVCCFQSLCLCGYIMSMLRAMYICWFQYMCTGHLLPLLFATMDHLKLCISFSLIILRNRTFFSTQDDHIHIK